MMTPREALRKDGTILVKDGRGRLSKDADARCRELAGMGWSIKGYAVSSKPTAEVATVVKKTVVSGEKTVSDYVIFYDENDYKAVAGKKVYGMRECCNTCMVSLVQCHCGSPVILGGVKVSIVPR